MCEFWLATAMSMLLCERVWGWEGKSTSQAHVAWLTRDRSAASQSESSRSRVSGVSGKQYITPRSAGYTDTNAIYVFVGEMLSVCPSQL